MKNIIIIAATILGFSCKAQTVPLEDIGSLIDDYGVYYKDINHYLDNFVGTYVYTSGDKTFTIKLEKTINFNKNDYYHIDMLIGAYEYKIGTTVIANTFPHFNSNTIGGDSHKISTYGLSVNTGDWAGCTICDPNAIWVDGSIQSMTTLYSYEIRLKRVVHNGQQALTVMIVTNEPIAWRAGVPKPAPQPSSFPFFNQDFILIKQ